MPGMRPSIATSAIPPRFLSRSGNEEAVQLNEPLLGISNPTTNSCNIRRIINSINSIVHRIWVRRARKRDFYSFQFSLVNTNWQIAPLPITSRRRCKRKEGRDNLIIRVFPPAVPALALHFKRRDERETRGTDNVLTFASRASERSSSQKLVTARLMYLIRVCGTAHLESVRGTLTREAVSGVWLHV